MFQPRNNVFVFPSYISETSSGPPINLCCRRPDFHDIVSILQSMRARQPGSSRPLIIQSNPEGKSGSISVHRITGPLKKTVVWKLKEEEGSAGSSRRTVSGNQSKLGLDGPEGLTTAHPKTSPSAAALTSDMGSSARIQDDDEHEEIVLTAASYRVSWGEGKLNCMYRWS